MGTLFWLLPPLTIRDAVFVAAILSRFTFQIRLNVNVAKPKAQPHSVHTV